MSRRPEQLSMLTLMGATEGKPPPFADFKLSAIFRDDFTGNIHEVTVVGPGSPAYASADDVDPWWDQPAQEEECNG